MVVERKSFEVLSLQGCIVGIMLSVVARIPLDAIVVMLLLSVEQSPSSQIGPSKAMTQNIHSLYILIFAYMPYISKGACLYIYSLLVPGVLPLEAVAVFTSTSRQLIVRKISNASIVDSATLATVVW